MSDTRQQRIEVLKNAARRKSEEKTRSAEAAIARLIKRGESRRSASTWPGIRRPVCGPGPRRTRS
ncbi:MAG: hypothetical protein QOD02_4315, partial [Mycobacterium sp.]|nr:hypothetical protein [Mycobacterium sp.]